jgi:hypothetical protein
VSSLAGLIENAGDPVRIACDTEFEGPHTLTIQFAARIGADLAVQVYRSPAVPEPPVGFDPEDFLPPELRRRFGAIHFRPVREIDAYLSPARVVADLFEVPVVEFINKRDGDARKRTGVLAAPLTVTLIAHFWTADFFRVSGEAFFTSLIMSQIKSWSDNVWPIRVQAQKLLGFKEGGRGRRGFDVPVLEYVREGEAVHPVKVGTFDTQLPFGPASLDAHAHTFLDVHKSDALSEDDKRHMLETFRRKPAEAYGYAVLDAVLTLAVEERMREEDRSMYEKLGFVEEDIPRLRATLGCRVAEMITKTIVRDAAAGSHVLSRTGSPLRDGTAGAVSQEKVKNLLAKGSADFIANGPQTRFGKQTGETHGGLLFSRSPTRFFHEANGLLRDVDLSGCYASIISAMHLYVGRPVIHEPGPGGLRLKDAVAIVRDHAADWDAWIIKVSGPITRMPNVLIPSTNGALTHANFQKRAAKKRAKTRRFGFIFDWLYEPRKAAGNATLYTDVVEAGVVA